MALSLGLLVLDPDYQWQVLCWPCSRDTPQNASVPPESGEATFEVYTWPERLVVESGGSRIVNCSTSCARPDVGGLETTMNKTLLEAQTQRRSYLISNISQDTVLLCHFTCAQKQQSKGLNVSVYREWLCAGPPLPRVLLLGLPSQPPPPWVPGVIRIRTGQWAQICPHPGQDPWSPLVFLQQATRF